MTRRPRVYVPSIPMRSTSSGARVPKIDMSTAEEFGEIYAVFEGDDLPHPSEMVLEASARLVYGPEDFVMLAGDPLAIAAVAAIAAAQGGGRVRFLKWVARNERTLAEARRRWGEYRAHVLDFSEVS